MKLGALALVSNYDSDNSEDESLHSQDSAKRRLPESNTELSAKRFCDRLPLPKIIGEVVNSDDNMEIDNPLEHDGRIRSFAHERGNWATYVYIPYDPPDFVISIAEMIVKQLSHLQMFLTNHYHISLTKTVVLKHHWIDLFVSSVRQKIIFIKRFVTVFDRLNVYCNEEKTRTFIGLDTKSGHNTLLLLVKQLDISLDEFRLPPYYENPSFHLSLAWCNGDKETEIRSLLPHIQACVDKIFDCNEETLYNYATHLEAKCGNKIFTFNLM